jgi:hypothetical protein
MRIAAALIGDLDRVMREEVELGAHAATVGTRSTVDEVKLFLRAETMKAFGSQPLANAWRGVTYPKGGKESLGAAGTVYSNAPHIIEAFSATTTIRSANGFFLAIPSPEAMAMRGSRKERPTPDAIERRLGLQLQFVYRRDGASLLVADLRRRTGKRGGFAAPSARTRSTETVVLFFLVPFVRLKQVFDLDATENRALDDLARNILEVWNRGRSEA